MVRVIVKVLMATFHKEALRKHFNLAQFNPSASCGVAVDGLFCFETKTAPHTLRAQWNKQHKADGTTVTFTIYDNGLLKKKKKLGECSVSLEDLPVGKNDIFKDVVANGKTLCTLIVEIYVTSVQTEEDHQEAAKENSLEVESMQAKLRALLEAAEHKGWGIDNADLKRCENDLVEAMFGARAGSVNAFLNIYDLKLVLGVLDREYKRAVEIICYKPGLDFAHRAYAVSLLHSSSVRTSKSAAWARMVICSASPSEILRLKDIIDAHGDFHDLRKLIFELPPEVREQTLAHFHKCAQAFRDRPRPLLVCADIDDTLYSSGGHWPAGSDARYKHHTLYPGVLTLLRELDIESNGQPKIEPLGPKVLAEPAAETAAAALLIPPRADLGDATGEREGEVEKQGSAEHKDDQPRELTRMLTRLNSIVYLGCSAEDCDCTRMIHENWDADNGENICACRHTAPLHTRVQQEGDQPSAKKGRLGGWLYQKFRPKNRGDDEDSAANTSATNTTTTDDDEETNSKNEDEEDEEDEMEENKEDHIPERALHLRYGHIAFVSARPHIKNDWTEHSFYERMARWRKEGKLWSYPTLIPGDMSSAKMVTGNYVPMAQKKFDNFIKLLTLYPEANLLFIGDNGQGDVCAMEQVYDFLGKTPSPVRFHAFVHVVQPLEKTPGFTMEKAWSWHDKGIRFVRTYVGLARLCTADVYHLLSEESAMRVKKAAFSELSHLRMSKDAKAARRRELELDANAPLKELDMLTSFLKLHPNPHSMTEDDAATVLQSSVRGALQRDGSVQQDGRGRTGS